MHLQCIATINCWKVTREHYIQKPYVSYVLMSKHHKNQNYCIVNNG